MDEFTCVELKKPLKVINIWDSSLTTHIIQQILLISFPLLNKARPLSTYRWNYDVIAKKPQISLNPTFNFLQHFSSHLTNCGTHLYASIWIMCAMTHRKHLKLMMLLNNVILPVSYTMWKCSIVIVGDKWFNITMNWEKSLQKHGEEENIWVKSTNCCF